ncbi:type IV secretion system protein [Nostoc sp. ATCC 53789]|uniref:type IV secretion system protein n=1 Tax=Nostoc sp. ATCC 53789 TaxID=76335 RepID=UPI000DEC7491|nr:type IV secretion system protein [Nostoc sp. ATCC 53789]QHG20867.1 hypothetical protein GJB62_33885 [Nostoc sp. ATCC 53789]RCJ22279.1 hypothetical protein A6V25_24195 [Nostoc sp. ATCC 53789]
MLLTILLAQSTGQQPGQNTGTTNSGEIVDGAIDGADLIVKSFANDWAELASGTSSIYIAVVAVSMLVAVVLVSFASLGWYRKFAEEGFSYNFVSEMVFPLLVIIMLTNNGFLLANTTIALKDVSANLNRSILSITRNGVKLKDAIRNVNADQSFILATQTALTECEKLETSQTDSKGNTTNPRQTCIKESIEKAQSDAREAREKRGTVSGTGSWNPLDIGGELVNSAIQGLVYVILSGLSAGFQYIVQLSFLLVAYVAPIFLALSLLPFESKPLYAWLSGWLGLTLILISYSIIVGIVASAIVDKPSSNPLLMQLIQAIFSPLLAVAIGTGGGMSVFTAFTSGIKFSVGLRK